MNESDSFKVDIGFSGISEYVTQEELQTAKEIVDNATSKPWAYDSEYRELTGPCIRTDYDMASVVVEKNDGEFIAWCRNNIPNLLTNLERFYSVLSQITEFDAETDIYQRGSYFGDIQNLANIAIRGISTNK